MQFLILFQLLNSERLSIFAADLQVAFLMFESLRTHLKFQLELYLSKLIDIITSDSLKVTYEHKEITLDTIIQLWRIPGFVTELYLNYDCRLYCSNLYEDLTKLLAKNAFPATSGVYHTHLLSLDALLTVIEVIEKQCVEKSKGKLDVANANICHSIVTSAAGDKVENIHLFVSRVGRQKKSDKVPTRADVMAIRDIKKVRNWSNQVLMLMLHAQIKGIKFD